MEKDLETYSYKEKYGIDNIKIGQIMVIELNDNFIPAVVVSIKANDPHFFNTYKVVLLEEDYVGNFYRTGVYLDFLPIWRRVVQNKETQKTCKKILKQYRKKYNEFNEAEFNETIEYELKNPEYKHSKLNLYPTSYGAFVEEFGLQFDAKYSVDVGHLHYIKKHKDGCAKIIGLKENEI